MDNQIIERIEALEAAISAIKNNKKDKQGNNDPEWQKEIKDMPTNTIKARINWKGVNSGSTFGMYTNFVEIFKADSHVVSKILSALGSSERIEILKEILKQERTATELLTICNLNTTGRVYHHLNTLENAGFITKRQDKYTFVGSVIGSFLLILAGSANLERKNKINTSAFDE